MGEYILWVFMSLLVVLNMVLLWFIIVDNGSVESKEDLHGLKHWTEYVVPNDDGGDD